MIALLFIFNLMAQEVLIQGPQTSQLLYEKKLMESPQLLSFTQHYESQHSQGLEPLLKLAQFEFLKGSMEKATDCFKKIAERRFEKMWPKKSQKIIHYSLLRLAQLDTKNQQSWLEKAYLFNPKLKIDETLFPPPMVKSYKEIAQQRPSQIWALPVGAEKFDKIFLNGIPLQGKQSFVKYPEAKVRLDFVSNRWKPINATVPLSDLREFKLSASPLASGSCENPQFLVEATESTQFRLLQENCSNPNPVAWTQQIRPKAPEHQTSNQPQWYKNKWLWVGVSVVAAGLAVSQLEQQNRGGGNPAPASKEPREFSNN